MTPKYIRNFSIIAHIDHGKSTLADRILEQTGALQQREMVDQVLDTMDLERERGITIKAHAVRLLYKSRDGEDYILNLIDTPGHVDFSYEVSRSLAACEGALLLVDATQGVEAQTLANADLALENDLELIPVVSKIDLPAADAEKVLEQIRTAIGLDTTHAVLTSAKTGQGTEEILEAIVRQIPHPKGRSDAPLKALIFDSWFDPYQGVVVMVRVIDGQLRPGMSVRLMLTNREHRVERLGVLTPKLQPVDQLLAGEVGFVIANIKTISGVPIGDTLTEVENPTGEALPGFREMKPMVFAGLYPTGETEYDELRDALEKLQLNDSSFFFEPESSQALGFGFHCGFLGLLHMEIVRERLEREFNLALIITAPSVRYRVRTRAEKVLDVENPAHLPDPGEIAAIEEPMIEAVVTTPTTYLGPLLNLMEEKRGVQKKFEYISPTRVLLTYELPLGEVVLDFYDRLKTLSRGYASFDYQPAGYRCAELVRLDVLVGGEPVDALSLILHRDQAYARGRQLVEKLKTIIPRQLFVVPIQAAIGHHVIARETVRALRKNVVAKCYGGDISRKRKLLEKQKMGKKRMKKVGKVDIPQEAFLAMLKVSE